MYSTLVIGIVTIAVALVMFYRKKTIDTQVAHKTDISTYHDRTTPDLPVSFGYKCVWFAVKTNNYQRLADIIGITNLTECNWKIGVEKAYEDSVFITPPIEGWMLVCGVRLPSGDNQEDIKEITHLLRTLSKELGETQFYCTHRVVEYHCWMRARAGNITRVYSYLGEAGENIVIEGEPTDFESKYNLINTFSDESKNEMYFENSDLIIPDEEFVMRLAGNWSINPSQLGNRTDLNSGLGYIGQRGRK